MTNLLAPAALWTLAALALPLAIHLWRRPPRTVRLGSLRFLRGHASRWRNLRWRERALLAARLALLAALALRLAHPVWRTPPPSHPQRWALLDPAAAPAGTSLERLRALQAGGAETRLFASGFPAVSTPTADGSAAAPDAWSLLREADAALPAGSSLTVFAPGRLASLRGVRPALTRVRIEWIDTSAVPPAAGAPRPPKTPVRPLAVLVLHDPDRAEDARYVAAAWRAAADAEPRSLHVSVGRTGDAVDADVDWIFWLGSQPVPPTVAARTANVLDDAASAVETPPGWIVSPLPPVRLWRRGLPVNESDIWTDGFGQSLLTRTHDARGHAHWHFASRFNPAWNDLSLGSALPAALRTLLLADAGVENDPRLADPSQFPPSELPAAAAPTTIALPGTEADLRPACWAAAALLFGIERLLSHRRAPRAATTAAAPPPRPVPSR